MGMKREQVLEKGYDFALAQQIALQKRGEAVTTHMMSWAARQVSDALPGAYRIYDLHNWR